VNRHSGFTLIEVMVTVAIVAILASIAYPSYQDYILRGRIAEATTGLQESRVRMEQAFLDNRTYVGAVANGWNAASTCNATGPQTGQSLFQYTCAGTATTYTITATGTGAMNGFVYTINEQNARTTTGVPNVAKWGAVPRNCWTLKPGGAC
jgi:type IV pilus assembly protein PilE